MFHPAAALVNINVALDEPTLSQEVTAFILSLVAAAIGAGVAASLFLDRVYLLSIAWALAAVSDNDDYRKRVLPNGVADGFTNAITGLYVALLIFAGLTLLYSWFFASQLEKGQAAAPREDRGPRSRREGRHKAGHDQRDLTSAIVAP